MTKLSAKSKGAHPLAALLLVAAALAATCQSTEALIDLGEEGVTVTNVTIKNELTVDIKVVLTAPVLLGVPYTIVVRPGEKGPIRLNLLAPLSSPKLTIQPDKNPIKTYAITGSAASRVLSFTGFLTIEVKGYCNSNNGLLLVVKNILDIVTEALCAEEDYP